jgi:hypothetical protein
MEHTHRADGDRKAERSRRKGGSENQESDELTMRGCMKAIKIQTARFGTERSVL